MKTTDERITFHTYYLRENLRQRNDPSLYWRRIHRQLARVALSELRYLTGRPSKRINVPTAYGHCA